MSIMIKFCVFCFLLSMSYVVSAQTLKQIAAAKKQEELATKTSKIVPPITIRASFAKQFPGTAVNWEKVRGHFEANYVKNGKKMSVTFNDDGEKIESEVIIPKSEMPAVIMEYIDTHFKGEKITETSIIKKANGEEIYEVELKGLDVHFTKAGKYIRTLKE